MYCQCAVLKLIDACPLQTDALLAKKALEGNKTLQKLEKIKRSLAIMKAIFRFMQLVFADHIWKVVCTTVTPLKSLPQSQCLPFDFCYF